MFMTKVLIVIPAYNEEKIIEENLLKLDDYLRQNLNDDYLVLVSDNNSTDRTSAIVNEICGKRNSVGYFFVAQKGKGLAIKKAWQNRQDEFDVFLFMDADLATGLEATPALLSAIKDEGGDLAIGSRYLPGSQVKRSLLRRLFSFCYRLFLKFFLGTKIKDFPCGFKAVNRKTVKEIVPQIQNNSWFFDTELLYLAEKKGYKIKEIPVRWQEPRTKANKSRVNLPKVSWQYFREVLRLKFRRRAKN